MGKIALREIERAIELNSTIDKTASKVLTLQRLHTGVNQGIPRCVFIYIALKAHYNSEEICDYLAITPNEYSAKEATLAELYDQGREAFTTSSYRDPYSETYHNTPLIFYRKLLLAQNYLRYRCGWEV
jgi:hypothetical protein